MYVSLSLYIYICMYIHNNNNHYGDDDDHC